MTDDQARGSYPGSYPGLPWMLFDGLLVAAGATMYTLGSLRGSPAVALPGIFMAMVGLVSWATQRVRAVEQAVRWRLSFLERRLETLEGPGRGRARDGQ